MAAILLIYDEEDFRHLIASVLSAAGHNVRQATNGVDGVRLYREHSPDLVLTDIVMPDQEGLSTIMEIRRIKARVDTERLPRGAWIERLWHRRPRHPIKIIVI